MGRSGQLTKDPTPIFWELYKSDENSDATGSSTPKTALYLLDQSKRKIRKGRLKTGEVLDSDEADIEGDKTSIIEDPLYLYLKQYIENSNSTLNDVKYSLTDTYTISKNVTEEKVKEAEDKMQKIQTNFNYLKYYSFIWSFCALLLGFFFTAGISGMLGPFSSFVGGIMAAVGIVGGILDYKDRVNKNNA